MAQRVRCPGGRPSVRYQIDVRTVYSYKLRLFPSRIYYRNTKPTQIPTVYADSQRMQTATVPLPIHSRLWCLVASLTLMRRLGTAPFITSEIIRLLCLLINLMNAFAINLKSWDTPSFHSLRWLKGFACDPHGTQAAPQKLPNIQSCMRAVGFAFSPLIGCPYTLLPTCHLRILSASSP